MPFQNPQHYTVKQLLLDRLFRIPDYQRAYSWEARQRVDLFSDIAESHFKDQEHFMATLVGLASERRRIGAGEFQVVQLVDGQQRITTIVLLLKALEKHLSDQDSNEKNYKREINELLIKRDEQSLLLLQTNHDSSDIYINYMQNGTIHDGEVYQKGNKNLIDAMKECEAFVSNWKSDGKNLIELLSTIYNRLSMLYHELTNEATVYRVFEVLNSRGMTVQWIDKLKSQMMSLLFQNLNDDTQKEALREMKNIWSEIYKSMGLDSSVGDEAMRFSAAYKRDNKPNKIPGIEESYSILVSSCGTDYGDIMKTAKLLCTVVSAVAMIRNSIRLRGASKISHARFVAVAIQLSTLKAQDKSNLKRLWEKVTFRIFGIGGADSRSKVGDYVRLGYEIFNTPLNKTMIRDALNNIGGASGYDINSLLKTIDTNWYDNWEEELRYLLYKYDEYLASKNGITINENDWNMIWADSAHKSIEHILPQSSNKKDIHRLGNLTLLPPGVNSSLQDKSPREKAKTYLQLGTLATKRVGESIEANGGKWDKSMIDERERELITFMRSEWGD